MRAARITAQEGRVLERCKTCGKEFVANQVMTYSVYGFCSWDCLMKRGSHRTNNGKDNRKQNGNRNSNGQRSRWA